MEINYLVRLEVNGEVFRNDGLSAQRQTTLIILILEDLKPAVNFSNVLRTAFTHADPKCAKRQSNQQCRLVLLGTTDVKAVHRTLMKLTPGPIKLFFLRFLIFDV